MQRDSQLNFLFNAVCSNDLFLLQEVLMEYPELDVNEPVMGLTALHVAAEKGYSSCVTVLLAAGAMVDQQDMHGLTPLMTGIQADYPLVTSQLLKASADPNISAGNAFTALHFACLRGNDGIVNMLLSSGASPYTRTTEKLQSPLSIAIFRGWTDIVQTLLLGSVYVNPRLYAKSEVNKCPLAKSIELGHYTIARLLVITGYSAVPEINSLLKTPMKTCDSADLSAWLFVKTYGSSALSLQAQCCLAIRQSLHCNITNKAQCLKIPTILKDLIAFKHYYTPPNLSSDQDIYNYFDKNVGIGDLH